MLYDRLNQLEENDEPINVGIIGAGTFGTQIIARICHMNGMRVAATADLLIGRAVAALQLGGASTGAIVNCETSSTINDAIRRREFAVTEDPAALIESDVDVVVEATGNAEAGTKHGFDAIAAKKHVVMVTIEADVIVGATLKQLADEAGVIYSLAYGDEPALAVELYEWARTLGFRVIAAGKGTRFIPEFRKATPDDVPRLYGFTGEDYNAQVFCSFLDGTKHAIESVTLSNATGLAVDVRGMHFPAIDLREMPDQLCLKSKGGILNSEGVVEAVSSMRPDKTNVERNVRGGVFAVIDAPDRQAIESMASYDEIIGMMIGKTSGQAMIYRPQHFVGHEMPLGIARMLLSGQSIGAPIGQVSEVVSATKKRLTPGTILDGEGGYTVCGLAERAEIAHEQKLVPIGLTQGAEVLEEIAEEELITYDNVRLKPSLARDLKQRQDSASVSAFTVGRSASECES
jgi:predicted homoserine dehydrogenase-like protein